MHHRPAQVVGYMRLFFSKLSLDTCGDHEEATRSVWPPGSPGWTCAVVKYSTRFMRDELGTRDNIGQANSHLQLLGGSLIAAPLFYGLKTFFSVEYVLLFDSQQVSNFSLTWSCMCVAGNSCECLNSLNLQHVRALQQTTNLHISMAQPLTPTHDLLTCYSFSTNTFQIGFPSWDRHLINSSQSPTKTLPSDAPSLMGQDDVATCAPATTRAIRRRTPMARKRWSISSITLQVVLASSAWRRAGR